MNVTLCQNVISYLFFSLSMFYNSCFILLNVFNADKYISKIESGIFIIPQRLLTLVMINIWSTLHKVDTAWFKYLADKKICLLYTGVHLIKGSSESKVLIIMKANRGVLVFKSWSKERRTNPSVIQFKNKCAEEPWCLITSHSQNDLKNVPPKEVCYSFDSKRVCVA